MNNDQLIEAFWIAQGGKPNDPADIFFYGSSWDMLMPVIEKISDLNPRGYFFREDWKIWIAEFSDGSGVIEQCSNIRVSSISAHYKCLVGFIQWYNKKQ